jgi:hypothetical protein
MHGPGKPSEKFNCKLGRTPVLSPPSDSHVRDSLPPLSCGFLKEVEHTETLSR